LEESNYLFLRHAAGSRLPLLPLQQVLIISVSVSVKIMLPDNPDNLVHSLPNKVNRVSKVGEYLPVQHPVQVTKVIVLISGMREADKAIHQVLVVPVLISGISPERRKPLKPNRQIKKYRIRLKQHLHA
jgi:hypothetical protein